MTIRRFLPVLVGAVLVAAGLVGFFVLDGVTADVVCAIAVVAGLATVRIGSRPRRDQVV